MSRYDTVVIGAGLAGLTTACQLAQANQKVLLVSSGIGALLLASSCIDVLGFQPADSPSPLENPLAKLDDFLAERPDHPYHLVGQENIQAGLEGFLALVNQDSLDYRGQTDQNLFLPSTVGAIHPTCLAPASLANGDLKKGGKILVAGFRELRDFYPTLISENLNAQELGVQATAVTIDAPAPIAGKMDVTPIELARAFDTAEFRRRVVDAVRRSGQGYDRIGFPAVLGLKQHPKVIADLQKGLDRPVFEISTLPPSVPGRRLYELLKQLLVKAGSRVIIGSKIIGGAIDQGRVSHIRMETVIRPKTITADNYVLATGGIFGGGIQTDADGQVWESIFGLPVVAETNRHKWFAKDFVSPEGQPVDHFGLKVNSHLNPVDENDTPLAENLFVVGASIAGAEWIRGRTGDGVAVTTAAAAVKTITG